MNIRIASFILISLLSGCATQPVPNSEASAVPQDRILDAAVFEPKDGFGKVTVKRDSGFVGSICATRLFIDAKPTADIRISEKATVFLPEGDYIFSASSGLCGGGITEVRGTVKFAKPISFRIGYGTNGEFKLTPTAF